MKHDINSLKVVLAEKKLTNKWLSEQVGKYPTTISKWCTNTLLPNLETLVATTNLSHSHQVLLRWPIKK